MKKIYKLLILFGLLSGILFVSLIFFINKENQKTKNDTSPEVNIKSEIIPAKQEIILSDEITISIQEDKKVVLQEDEKIVFYYKSLQPTFVIEKDKEVSDLEIYLDGSKDNLIHEEKNISSNNQFRIKLPYMLNLKSHSIEVSYVFEEQESTKKYNFILIFYDDFSGSLGKSKFWGMTESALKCCNNWKIENGKLVADPVPNNAKEEKSSLFFIKRLRDDFFVQYDLTTKSNKVALNTYLLKRGLNFIFGEKGNREIILKSNKVLARENFIFETNKTYHVRIIRKQNMYKVFVTVNDDFSNDDLLIVYEDKDIERLNIPFDPFGFTVYKNSGNIEIDNFYATNEYISDIFNYNEKE
jgi:hypothetical protein